MRVLAISTSIPYEGVPHAGGLFLLRHLGELVEDGHVVTVVAPSPPATAEDARRAPDWLSVKLAPWAPEATPSSVTGVVRRLRRASRWIALDGAASEGLWRSGLCDLLPEADVVELHFPEIAPLAQAIRRETSAPIISFAHDVSSDLVSLRLRRSSRRTRAKASLLAPIRRRNERKDLDAADLILTFTEADGDRLRQIGVRTEIFVADPALEQPSRRAVRDGRQVLFTGAMWRKENSDGVLWLLREVWPTVHDAVPEARLVIAGADPPAEVCAAARSLAGVDVTGYLPDLDPEYVASSVFVAPVFVGSGLKFKVPQAMLYGLPVIATTNAARGVVDVAPAGTFWSVTDDATVMGSAIIDALRRPEVAGAVGDVAASWCERQYSFSSFSRRLRTRYDDLATQLP